MSMMGCLISIVLYIAASVVIFRVILRRFYRTHSRLTGLAAACQSLVFFSWGALTWANLPPAWPSNPIAPCQRVVGWLLLTAGLAAMVGMILWFGLARASGLRVNRLVQCGPYRVSRNPQLIACIAAVIGYTILWLSWCSVAWLVALIVASHAMVLTEEEHLGRIFGREYDHYRDRVPRYIGLLPKRVQPAG